MLLKFYRIPNLKKLVDMVQKSKGNIFLQIGEETFYDLKSNNKGIEHLLKEAEEKRQFIIHVFDTKDYLDFVNYMVGAKYE